MLSGVEKRKLKTLITDTVLFLCKNGLETKLDGEFCIEGLIGITNKQDDLMLVSFKEILQGMNDSAADDDGLNSEGEESEKTPLRQQRKRKSDSAPAGPVAKYSKSVVGASPNMLVVNSSSLYEVGENEEPTKRESTSTVRSRSDVPSTSGHTDDIIKVKIEPSYNSDDDDYQPPESPATDVSDLWSPEEKPTVLNIETLQQNQLKSKSKTPQTSSFRTNYSQNVSWFSPEESEPAFNILPLTSPSPARILSPPSVSTTERVYKHTQYRQYSRGQFEAACKACREGLSLQRASIMYDIPWSTLNDYVKSFGIEKFMTKSVRPLRYKKYTQEQIDAAYKAVTEAGLSLSEGARMYSVPWTTLRDRVNRVKWRSPSVQLLGASVCNSVVNERIKLEIGGGEVKPDAVVAAGYSLNNEMKLDVDSDSASESEVKL